MNRRQFMMGSVLACMGLWADGAKKLLAQAAYPSSPVTILVGFAPGGAADLSARAIADHVKRNRKAPVAVEFRPGAGATLATGQVARSKPDGGTISLFSVSPLLVAPQLQKVPYDSLKDFTYIAAFSGIAIPFYVKTESQFRTWPDVLKFAKDNPRQFRWGTAAVRGLAHIATEAAFHKEGVQTTFVPFTGGAEAITAMLGGHIQAVVSSDYGPHLEAGTVRLLAETGPDKIPGFPNVPTYKELGYPLSVSAAYGLFGPAGLPAAVVAWWEGAVKEMMETPEYSAYLKQIRAFRLFQDAKTFQNSFSEAYRALTPQLSALGLIR